MAQETDDYWLETQRRIAQDEQGTQRDALIDRLKAHAASFKQQMDGGVTPDEFARLERLHRGFSAAAEVVGMSWQAYHDSP